MRRNVFRQGFGWQGRHMISLLARSFSDWAWANLQFVEVVSATAAISKTRLGVQATSRSRREAAAAAERLEQTTHLSMPEALVLRALSSLLSL
jgi:hypothetical protein